MPNVEVRDVPQDVYAALVRRARAANCSLEEFLAGQLAAIAADEPTMDDVLATADGLDV